MKKKYLLQILIVVLILIAVLIVYSINKNPAQTNLQNAISSEESNDALLSQIKLPPGFKIKYFATNIESSPRFMLVLNNTVFASMVGSDKIIALIDNNQDGEADKQIVFMENLKNPHSIDYYNRWFYIGEEDKIIRIQDLNN